MCNKFYGNIPFMGLQIQKGQYVCSYARQAIDINFKGISIQTVVQFVNRGTAMLSDGVFC